ncbi:hypothetical protein CONPUDRAFT_85240 [Coniophora puteana RWD-64-598 SS2]|uniref:Uncharacterized protein n=1 Tax=Coniophora puteana (strain RWD-64-598) TaxID=741705 RepID=A0A5M3MBS1_CONPW|nr:uncharacterized protein CONPUDRAFT_85240 [Coniophora puteana RWD-64-598 SS2]EIW76081.1 hypothetical protein CONPUDRAFT_85240 [Coniophora puteana RWD-64-598 SS2]
MPVMPRTIPPPIVVSSPPEDSGIPDPSPVLSPELRDSLKRRTEDTLLHIIEKNRYTQWASKSPELQSFREALEHQGSRAESPTTPTPTPTPNTTPTVDVVEFDREMLLENYRDHIPLTTYPAYEPFVSKLMDPEVTEDEVKDLLSPGLPFFVACSSATSGKVPKYFPKYIHPAGQAYESVDNNANPMSDRGGKNLVVYSLTYRRLIEVTGEGGKVAKKIPVTLMSSGSVRMQHKIPVEADEWAKTMTAPRATSPIAVSFIDNYRTYLLIHGFFALGDVMLENVNTLFGTVFLDMIRYIEEEWDHLLDCLEHGKLPNFEGLEEVRKYLEPKVVAKPERAAELRELGIDTSTPGWCVRVWPNLRVVVGICSGVFAAVIPKIRHYVGPDVSMRSLGFTASETYVGMVYKPEDLNLYKTSFDDIIEYLDISAEEQATSLVSCWDIQTGSKYEIVVTTRDGMWRYRLGDIVEVAGFDPMDGAPILRYIERRNVVLRFYHANISERELASAIFAAQEILGPVVEFTVMLDRRTMPVGFGFIVELQGGPNGELSLLKEDEAHRAPGLVHASLCAANENYENECRIGHIGHPTIRIVAPGTFREYRKNKIEAMKGGAGQAKVPVVMLDQEMQDWVLERVVREVHRPAPEPVTVGVARIEEVISSAETSEAEDSDAGSTAETASEHEGAHEHGKARAVISRSQPSKSWTSGWGFSPLMAGSVFGGLYVGMRLVRSLFAV